MIKITAFEIQKKSWKYSKYRFKDKKNVLWLVVIILFFCTNCSVHCYLWQNLSSDGWHTNKTEQVTFIVRNNSITGEPTEHVSNKAIDSDGKTVIVLSPSKQSHYNINNMMNKKDTWAVSCMQLIIWPSHSERNNENLLKIHK